MHTPTRLASAFMTLCALSACDGGGATAPSADSAAVEAAARGLLSAYAAAEAPAQAETAITLFGTPGFVERLKAQAQTCRAAASAGGEMPASCAKDPLFCGEGPAPVAGVSVKNASAGVASAEVGIAHPEGAVTSMVALTKVGDAWKVDAITCPQ